MYTPHTSGTCVNICQIARTGHTCHNSCHPCCHTSCHTSFVACPQELDISWNKIKPEGVDDLCQGLEVNMGLVKLSLAWNGLEDSGVVGVLCKEHACMHGMHQRNGFIWEVTLGQALCLKEF
jgi:hypothetical protein